jgi:hypothetical protein
VLSHRGVGKRQEAAISNRIRRAATATGFVTALIAAPLAVATVGTPAVSWACPVGQVDQTGGCAPNCQDGQVLDTRSGSCEEPAAAPAHPPHPPKWNGGVTPGAICAPIIPAIGWRACI